MNNTNFDSRAELNTLIDSIIENYAIDISKAKWLEDEVITN